MHRLTYRLLFLLFLTPLIVSCGSGSPSGHDEGEDVGMIFRSRMQSATRLQLGRMTVSKLAVVDDRSMADAVNTRQKIDAALDAVKIGSRKAAYSYDTYLDAFIDLSKLSPSDVQVDTVRRRVWVVLPAVEIELAGRQPEMREEHYRVSGLRSQIDARERASLKEKMNASLMHDLDSNDEFARLLRVEAERKGREYFIRWFAAQGYDAEVTYRSVDEERGVKLPR